MQFGHPEAVMQYAVEIASQAAGAVEPNPLVGAVLVDENLQLLSSGYHQVFGGPHAERNALANASHIPDQAELYVTLEPCHHHGKTPPCTDAILEAGLKKVTIGCLDPAPHTDHQGVNKLRAAGVEVQVGCLQKKCEQLIRPFTKRMRTGLPYVHAKWAMTLDGKIATRSGSSQWISNEQSRQLVHQLRGRMDGILVGRGTLVADNPTLTARPPGPRTPLRIVLDSTASLLPASNLVRTLDQGPVLLICREDVPEERIDSLQNLGVEVLAAPLNEAGKLSLEWVLHQLGERGMTNLLVEGGGHVLGSFLDAKLIDEVHTFIAPKIVGGQTAPGPIAGEGVAEMSQALVFEECETCNIGGDYYFRGLLPLHIHPESTIQ